MVYWEGSPTGFGASLSFYPRCLIYIISAALHYPYVLAFEPTFVEIRHVETGSMSQIIQGNNLRCVFADTPPSTTHSANQYNPYQQQQQGYGYNGYGQQYPNPYMPRTPLSDGRDEILMVSDDRVMRLQMTQTARAALRM